MGGNGRRGVAVLGSTGSIGRSTLDVLRRQRDHFELVALTAGRNREQFERQLTEWRPAFAGCAVARNTCCSDRLLRPRFFIPRYPIALWGSSRYPRSSYTSRMVRRTSSSS